MEQTSIAVVGMAGVFPGAITLDQYWRNIIQKVDASGDVPPERWIVPYGSVLAPEFAPDKAFHRRACLVDRFEFDPDGLNIDVDLAKKLDPMHQLVLYAGRAAMGDAGPETIDRDRTGTVLAAIALPTDGASAAARRTLGKAFEARLYEQAGRKITPAPLDRTTALSAQVTAYPAQLLARSLNLGAGAYTLDAACASSIYALKLACDTLSAHRADAMIAGGVSRPDCLYTQIGFSQLRALSRSGRCATFSPQADGLVVGEGAGLLVLKRLEDAINDQNKIYGVIRGIGLSNDLRGNLLAPDSEGQLRAMRAAYNECDWIPTDVDLIECHGAGTPLGDKAELESLVQLWRDRSWQSGQAVLGSVKSMIGHLLTAAAAASMIKVLLAIRHRTLPPTLHVAPDDTVRPLSETPFRILSEAEPWPPRREKTPLRAAVNAFGFGGINAHLLVEEYLPPSKPPKAMAQIAPEPVAIVGIGAAFGNVTNRQVLADTVLTQQSMIDHRPPKRWQGAEIIAADIGVNPDSKGNFLDTFDFFPARYRIPPNELDDIVPQHLLMLNVAHEALSDAGILSERDHIRTGAVIGMAFDHQATDFHLRWDLENRIAHWGKDLEMELSGTERVHWLAELRATMGPPLTHARTLGALGSMVASRLTRSFRLGGPSFVVSEADASGLRALEIGIRALQRNEADCMLIGAVDLPGDFRCVAIMDGLKSEGAESDFIGEGAAAFVLKKVSDARRDGDRVYALIDGFGTAGGTDTEACRYALEQAANEAGIRIADIDLYETDRAQDEKVLRAVAAEDLSKAANFSTVSSSIGHCGAAASMAALTAAALRLTGSEQGQKRRYACVSARSAEGSWTHAILGSEESRESKSILQAKVSTDPSDHGPRVVIRVGDEPPCPQLPSVPAIAMPAGDDDSDLGPQPTAMDQQLIHQATNLMNTTAEAHQTFLKLSAEMTRLYGDTFRLQNELMSRLTNSEGAGDEPSAPLFDRSLCLEFAIGSAAKVLGPEFAVLDTYRARVRLPDEPLMLVDRILTIDGEKGGLGPGRIVTEHDVLPDAWYLDGRRAPVCISVEAGQADLFLSSYLGIDLQVQGQRTYRLLDATVTFHRGLPEPGDTIRYEIEIEKFVRQDETHLFFFHFAGSIDDAPLITMTDGCAGFFTEQEVAQSGGILRTPEELTPVPEQATGRWEPWVPGEPASYTDEQVDALRRGDLAAAFGPAFAVVSAHKNLWLPDGRMRLIHRVLHLDPAGGRYGNGIVQAEADIHPDDWFLTCHFVDDMVMPGTLMYECCAHTLRVLLQRMGWVSDHNDARYEPVVGVRSKLKCRGPVTPKTQKVVYEVEVRHIGYTPHPHVIGDAHMYADGHRIVLFENISMQLSGVTSNDLVTLWGQNGKPQDSRDTAARPNYDRGHMIQFASGNPSQAFGAPYRPFDTDRFIARLPRPPYLFIDRIKEIEPEPWVFAPGGWITAEYRTRTDDWYFGADRSGRMPFCVLLEIALQPCGWLAAYMGSALRSDQDLKFRNLGGEARFLADVIAGDHVMETRCRLTKVSEVADMIIEDFEFEVRCDGAPVYVGTTYFGFFTEAALASQSGIRKAQLVDGLDSGSGSPDRSTITLPRSAPLSPTDALPASAPGQTGLVMPAGALTMLDTITLSSGDRPGQDRVHGSLAIDPKAWYFKAHFYQDPVCPGSLGIESLIQLMRQYTITYLNESKSNYTYSLASDMAHQWTYRGQILTVNRRVDVQAAIEPGDGSPTPSIMADGLLAVDGLVIYEMKNFVFKLSPRKRG